MGRRAKQQYVNNKDCLAAMIKYRALVHEATEKEKESIGAASVAYFINSLFPLIDNFEMAMSQEEVSKELETFNNLLTSVLEGLQVEEIGTIGENFDPSIHEAVEHSGEGDSQIVETILRKGYLFQGNLIRPAMVIVKSE